MNAKENSQPSTSVPAQPGGETPKECKFSPSGWHSVIRAGGVCQWCEEYPPAEPTATVDTEENAKKFLRDMFSESELVDAKGLLDWERAAEAMIAFASRPLQGWVSVAERLPEEYEDYLVWIVNDQFYAKHPDIMTFDPHDKSWGPHPEVRKDSNRITHWAKLLPAPPATSREE